MIPIGPGATGDAVFAVQRLLREKVAAAVPTDGVYGAVTTAAVKAFQAHMGLTQTGSVNAATWRALVWHFELPRFSPSGLCDYSSGNGPANWGTATMTSTLEAAGAAMVAGGFGRVAVGDVSLEHGGDIPGHVRHEVGLEADIRPMRNGQRSVLNRDELENDGIRPRGDAVTRPGDPGGNARPREGHPVQRPGADRRGTDHLSVGARRPSPRDALRGVVQRPALSLLIAPHHGKTSVSVTSLVNKPGLRPPRTT